ncbi:HD domain-containing protein [Streptomyces hokutonensis]|uniref:HD domain-containing protein n=1 Tax=Streptomyces hokutonensis TaxID=1306990 RepID=UPI0003805689|nr:HD domain-containing protein [Streptomyces hokutonensis]
MNDTLSLPTGTWHNEILVAMQQTVNPSVVNHCIRSFLWARLYAEHIGALDDAAYDENLLFAACVGHDLSTGTLGKGTSRFEVEGADLVADILTRHHLAAADVDRVWEAIALHTSDQIAERRGLITRLTYEGIYIDFGKNADLVTDWATQVHHAFPRLKMVRSLTDVIVAHAALSENAVPRYGIAFNLVRERETDGETFMERTVSQGPWGE